MYIKMKKILLPLVVVSFWVLGSCTKKNTVGTDPNPVAVVMTDLVIPNSFNFETTGEVSVGILVKNASTSLSDVPVSIYLDYPGSKESPNTSARLVGTFISESDGRIDVKLRLPASQDSLYLKTNYIGIESEAGFSYAGTTASYKYGEGNDLKSAPLTPQSKGAFVYESMGKVNSLGVPAYLDPISDVISQGLLNDINASLPEYKHLTDSHPQYLLKGNEANLVLKEQADVWITFVSEGASYLNSIGYYTYDAKNPPQTKSDIKKYTLIFPNASMVGSGGLQAGGGLKSGNKVKLGRFNSGTGIGWFIVANGWNGKEVVNAPTYFSDPILNPETNPDRRQHTVLLYDNLRSILLLGFEDLIRTSSSTSDDDFNDAIFYATANPVKAIDISNIPSIDTPLDDDKDGVSNAFDEYPQDSKRAFTSYYPAKEQYNSLLVEDLWPSLGDFDFNDMVLDCQYKQVTNAKLSVVEMFIKLKVRAIGASYKNGFGIQLPVASSTISSVTITDQSGTINKISPEADKNKVDIIAFENAFTLLPSLGGGTGVNVTTGSGWQEPKDIELHITFTTAQTVAALGTAPYNPFVFVNGDRTKEIHLAGSAPTSKANTSFFGESDDNTNPSTGNYYKSKKNLVWMMEVPSSFQYVIEKTDITKAYLKFGAWAESGGKLSQDWYLDISKYRDKSLIYSK
jgi:LruC domain-containing protein